MGVTGGGGVLLGVIAVVAADAGAGDGLPAVELCALLELFECWNMAAALPLVVVEVLAHLLPLLLAEVSSTVCLCSQAFLR